MSASKDKDQKVKFIFPNLYQIQNKKTVETQKVERTPSHSQVIKAQDINNGHLGSVRVNPYVPAEMIGKRIERPSSLPPSNQALESLKNNLKQLNDLQARLRFMLKELEDLVKE